MFRIGRASVARRESVQAATGSVMVDGHSRTFTSVTAVSAQLPPPAVLVVVLQGSNQTGARVRGFSGQCFDQLAVSRNAIVVYPDAWKGLWNDARLAMQSPARREGINDVAFIVALIDHFTTMHRELAVYVVGYSNGGQMAIRLVHEIPERLNGAVLIGATQPTPDNLVVMDRHQPVPIVEINGTRDPIVPYGGGVVSFWGFRSRGSGLSALDSARYFADRNGISNAPTVEHLPHRPESGRTSVTVNRWRQDGCESVTFYTVTNGGHVIPNPVSRAPLILGRTTRDINAADTVAELIANRTASVVGVSSNVDGPGTET